MGKAHDVIKTFMQTLGSTSSVGRAALDEATRASSNFTSWQEVIDKMVSDCASYNGDGAKFLQEKCRINLDNDDTGAITGYDAGGDVIKTDETIIPEDGAFVYPNSSTSTFSGLTVYFPDENSLNDSQKLIVAALNSWWLPNSLNLIQESYGLGFENSAPSTKEIKVNFVDANTSKWSNSTAYIDSATDDTGRKAYDLSLNLHMNSFDNISSTDPNGSSPSGGLYLDNVIAHEMTHAVLLAAVDGHNYLPKYFTEGIAELTGGIDGRRTKAIRALAENSSTLNNVLKDDVSFDMGSEEYGYSYAGGYMLLRYFANQAAGLGGIPSEELLPSGATKEYGSTITCDSTFNGSLWLDGWDIFENKSALRNTIVRNVDASATTENILIAGNNQDNYIRAGNGNSNLWGGWYGNDTLYGGAGQDVFWYGNNEGDDNLWNVQSEDTVNLFDVSLADISGINKNDENKFVVTFHEGGSLNLSYGIQNGATFNLGADGTSWKYNNQNGAWYTV